MSNADTGARRWVNVPLMKRRIESSPERLYLIPMNGKACTPAMLCRPPHARVRAALTQKCLSVW